MNIIKSTIKLLSAAATYPRSWFIDILKGISNKNFPIFIKYPVTPTPRYGYGNPPNKHSYEIINNSRNEYNKTLQLFDEITRSVIISDISDDPRTPYWNNPWFTGLDALALYSYIAKNKPRQYIEIGSGNSTKFARKSINDNKLQTRILSIDPFPRTEIDQISDDIIRMPFEHVNIDSLPELMENDIIFFDGSHRSFMNSDVTVFFLELLPIIPKGVLIHIHDIHLPYDYPPDRAKLYESEQYLLATLLMETVGTKYEILCPVTFINYDSELSNHAHKILNSLGCKVEHLGASFWFKKI